MDGGEISILVIEQNERDALLYLELLEKSPLLPSRCLVINAKTLSSALSHLEKKEFQLILVNLDLPDSTGIETFNALQRKVPTTPIVILTDQIDEKLALKAISHGAQDYLPKSELDIHFFARIIRFALERHHIQEALRELTFTDELTGVYNRRGLITLAEQQIELSKRMNKGFFLFLIDVDNLKKINDTYGHQEGDRILTQTAFCLKRSFRQSDVIGRIGGDEFAILALSSSEESRDLLLNALDDEVAGYNAQRPHFYLLSLSCGTAYYDPNEAILMEELFERADRELYENKRAHHARLT